MNYEKKYLKYKKKYFNIKNQYGGDLVDDVLRSQYIIKKLNENQIRIPPEIIQKLSHSLSELNTFYISTCIEEQEVQQNQSKEEREKRMIPFIIVKILWINFFKNFCDKITEYHRRIIRNHDDSGQIRINDINQKLQSINVLLVQNWDYYLPPNLEDIQIPESNLTDAMLSLQVPVSIGFRNPPQFIRKNIIPFNLEYIIPFNLRSMEDTIIDINHETERNEVLSDLRLSISFMDNGIEDISLFIQEIFNGRKYSDLELLFQQNEIKFINLNMEYLNERNDITYLQLSGEID
jgi:hypothetical protein